MHKRRLSPDTRQCGYNVGRAQSTLSVSAVDYYLTLPVTCPPSPAISTVTLTPGRIRNIDQDMEALRASRQDNPFIRQVIASRESLADTLDNDNESDNTTLVSKEFPIDLDVDPMTLPDVHEHMIRSPPPTSWPKSPNHRVFHFPPEEDETLHVEVTSKEKGKSESKHKYTSWDGSESTSPLRSLPRPLIQDRFSLLTPGSLRSSAEDSIRLMSTDD
ncbi:hypothetical protein QE152_g726 [Popillia japonica]|uniref:Uncharacterized protein n=1 Tax=Popillia japonica TaxID=7064 RepID=A0AAW1NIT6_POPJA